MADVCMDALYTVITTSLMAVILYIAVARWRRLALLQSAFMWSSWFLKFSSLPKAWRKPEPWVALSDVGKDASSVVLENHSETEKQGLKTKMSS